MELPIESIEKNLQKEMEDLDDSFMNDLEVIQEGVVHLKHMLSSEEQILLLEGIVGASEGYKATRARNKNSHFMKTLAFDCKRQYDAVPMSFKEFSLRATQLAHSVCEIIPSSYKPDYITSFRYSVEEGKLTAHCDRVLGWVVLFSLGCTARFWVQGPLMKGRKNINFESGDVLVFNGGTEYDVKHGIDGIVGGTAPPFLENLREARVSLQLRQTERNDNRTFYKQKKFKKY